MTFKLWTRRSRKRAVAPRVLLSLTAVGLVLGVVQSLVHAAQPMIESPYEGVDWDSVDYVHSMSHQHGWGMSTLEKMWDMGYRHFAFSNYYPSRPREFPLPDDFLEQHPDALAAPNAEHHSCTDHRLHFNTLGSYYATGGRQQARKLERTVSPVEYEFTGVHGFDPDRAPWKSMCWLRVALSPLNDEEEESARTPLLTVDGAAEIHPRTLKLVGTGDIRDRPLTGKNVFGRGEVFYLRLASDRLRVRVDFDSSAMKVGSLVLMQGVHRPWRDAFRAALDGTGKGSDGTPIEGLVYPDGGGITINHPAARGIESYLEMLDFDGRVLGIEIWNERGKYGFGPLRDEENMLYYRHWDAILATGRRCFGFFVKDHGGPRGRNVLVLPTAAGRSREEREHDALRAYRNGCFFGSLGAIAVDEAGKPCMPYDYSEFRFSRIAVRRDDDGKPLGLEVAVGGADEGKRPNTQIRFVNDGGLAHVVNGKKSAFDFPRDADGAIACRYVRVEALAYPDKDNNGIPLTAAAVAAMDVYELSRMHDRDGKSPVPGAAIADMIFSQPIRVCPAP